MQVSPEPPTTAVPWQVVVPVKQAERAKSRLHPPAPLSRPDLARAVALDTLEAVCRAVGPRHVLLVSSDDQAVASAAALGVPVVADPGLGLNAAVRAGITRVQADEPGSAVAVLLGDLPALRPGDLTDALERCAAYERAFVPDADDTGTVLLTAGAGVALHPQFGPGSAARHAASAVRLDLDLPHLRQDVDDVAALAAAAELGLGRHTAAVLARAASVPWPAGVVGPAAG